VTSDEGKGDEWPALRAQILAADIRFGTPIWMGQTCSVAKRVLERMDAFFDETAPAGGVRFRKQILCPLVGRLSRSLLFRRRPNQTHVRSTPITDC
jgi:hypothetical protein